MSLLGVLQLSCPMVVGLSSEFELSCVLCGVQIVGGKCSFIMGSRTFNGTS